MTRVRLRQCRRSSSLEDSEVGYTTEGDLEGELSRQIRTARIPRLGHFAPSGVPASNSPAPAIPAPVLPSTGIRTLRLGGKKITAHGECHGGTGGGWTTDLRKLVSFSATLAQCFRSTCRTLAPLGTNVRRPTHPQPWGIEPSDSDGSHTEPGTFCASWRPSLQSTGTGLPGASTTLLGQTHSSPWR